MCMRKASLALAFILALLFSAVTETGIFDLATANPYRWMGYTTPPEDMQPHTITILSPQKRTLYTQDNLTLSFKVSLNSTYTWYYIRLSSVHYKASWQNESVSVYNWSHNVGMNPYDDDPVLTEFLYEGNLTGIPEGLQNITVTGYTHGSYVKGLEGYSFKTNITSFVIFMVSNTSEPFPVVSVATASITSVAVVSAGLLVYFKKRKR